MKGSNYVIASALMALPAGLALATHHEDAERAGDAADLTSSAEAPQVIDSHDTDGNGTLSEQEVSGTKLEDQFSAMDADGNGEVTASEYSAVSGAGGSDSDSSASSSTGDH